MSDSEENKIEEAPIKEVVTQDTTSVALQAVVMPAVTPQQAKEAWKSYQDLKKAILEPEDVQTIGNQQFLKKSYWRKAATFFNLSVDKTEERQEVLPNGDMVFHFVCKATAPNGRYAIGAGSCSVREHGRENSIHNTRTTAETRAWNRSVSNLIGGGEVSAEEMPLNASGGSYQSKNMVSKLTTGKPAKGDPNAFKEYEAKIQALTEQNKDVFNGIAKELTEDNRLSEPQGKLLKKILTDKFNSL